MKVAIFIIGTGVMWFLARWIDRLVHKNEGKARVAQFEELHALLVQGVTPILPRPEWDADVQYVAFCLDVALAYRRVREQRRIPCPRCRGKKIVVSQGQEVPCPENGGECDGRMTFERAWNIVGTVMTMPPSDNPNWDFRLGWNGAFEDLRGVH